MTEIIAFAQTHTDGILLIAQVLTVAFICVTIHKINMTKKRIDSITEAVENYLEVVMEEESSPKTVIVNDAQENIKSTRQNREEEQNHLITAVLEEIFP